jgi:hypothetical protein
MTQTTFTDNIVVQGTDPNKTQLTVQSPSGQTNTLQTWQDNAATPLAKVAADGRLQTGDMNLGAPNALIEANANYPSGHPQRGIQSLGRITGALASAVAWAVHELELLGTGGVSLIQTVLRVKLTNSNTGTSTNAQLRAGDFESRNAAGISGDQVGSASGIRGTVSNATGAHLARASGVEGAIVNDASGSIIDAAALEVVTPINAGTITNLYGLRVPDITQGTTNYAIHTDKGRVHLGDAVEVPLVSNPAIITNPPANFVALYPKLDVSTPRLYIKDSTGMETAVGAGGSVTSVGLSLPSMFNVTGSPVTSTGVLTGTLANQNANAILAGPSTGAAAAPTFRALAPADVPSLDASKITSGVFNTARIPALPYAATSHTHTVANVTDFAEAVDDRVAALLVPGSNVTLTYNDVANTLTIAAVSSTNIVDNGLCEGRLTLASSGDSFSSYEYDIYVAQEVYFVPRSGNKVALYNGSSWELFTFTTRPLDITGLAANTNYDIFLYNNAGTLALEASTGWSGLFQRTLTLQDGVYVKTGAPTRRYIGTIRTINTAGYTASSFFQRFVWSYYNPVELPLFRSSSTSHTYTLSTWRQLNNTYQPIELVLGMARPVKCYLTTETSISTVGNQAHVTMASDSSGSSILRISTINSQTEIIRLSDSDVFFAEAGHLALAPFQRLVGVGTGTYSYAQWGASVWG